MEGFREATRFASLAAFLADEFELGGDDGETPLRMKDGSEISKARSKKLDKDKAAWQKGRDKALKAVAPALREQYASDEQALADAHIAAMTAEIETMTAECKKLTKHWEELKQQAGKE